MENKKSKSLKTISIAILLAILSIHLGTFSANRSDGPWPIVQASPSQLNLNVTLHGLGATFPAPLISVWATQYHLTHPNVTISYLAKGSGAGQRALFNKTVDFAASDAPLQPAQRLLAPNVLHIPETVGSVVAAYDLPGIGIGLRLNGSVLANIYLGSVTKWNDPQIQSLNPAITLPNQNITVVHRSDGSGTTFIWTSFLCLWSALWCSTVGRGTTVVWPVGVGASGNPGVAQYVNSTAYTIGYVELNYAAYTLHMTYGAVMNPAGNFIIPGLTTTNYAVSNATATLPSGIGDWSSVSLLNEPGAQTYPIASFTYFLVYRELNVVPSMDVNETSQAHELVRFLNWVITTGQTYASNLYYVPLHSGVVAIDQASINSITFTVNAKPVHRTFYLKADSTLGWNLINPGPTLQVVSNDTVTLMLLSNDGAFHQWYMDFDNNTIMDANETNLASPIFGSTTVYLNYTFVASVWSQTGIPRTGSFSYRDSFHNLNLGTITILPQQTAAVFNVPSSITSSFVPVLDSSRVTTIGTLVVDTRTATVSGNVSIVAVDGVSGSIIFSKSYFVPGLSTSLLPSGVRQVKILFTAAVLPYTLSSETIVQFRILSSSTAASTQTGLTRNLDVTGAGSVNFIDLSIAAFHYGAVIGSPNYLATVDFLVHNVIDIQDFSIIAFYYQAPAFY